MDNSTKHKLIVKWISGNLSEHERIHLKNEINLNDMEKLIHELNNWSMPIFDVKEKIIGFHEMIKGKKK